MQINNSVSTAAKAINRSAQSNAANKTKKSCKSAMTDSFVEKIKEHAKKDAQKGTYMDKNFIQLRRGHMEQYVSPDRSGAIAQVSAQIQAMIKEKDPMLVLLDNLLDGCSAKFRTNPLSPNNPPAQTAEIFAPNGETIASYNSLGGGWTEIQTKEELKFQSEATAIYLQAFREARAEMKQTQNAPTDSTSVDIQA